MWPGRGGGYRGQPNTRPHLLSLISRPTVCAGKEEAGLNFYLGGTPKIRLVPSAGKNHYLTSADILLAGGEGLTFDKPKIEKAASSITAFSHLSQLLFSSSPAVYSMGNHSRLDR